MKRFLVLLLAGAASPAFAQHSGHTAPATPPADATCTPEHAAMGHCQIPTENEQQVDPHAGHKTPPKQQPQSAADPHAGHQIPAQEQPAPDPHSGHEMPAEEQPAADPHAGHQMPAEQQPTADPHAGHDMPAQEQPVPDPHAGHQMPAPAASPAAAAPATGGGPHFGHVEPGPGLDPPKAPPPPAAFSGPEHAADLIYDDQRMAAAREEMRRMHGDIPAYKIFFDRIETRVRDGRDGYLVEGQAWYGGDIDKVWFKGEFEGAWGEKVEKAEIQALWSHAIDPWFDLQTGIRYDPRSGPARAHLVLGVQGLAPYWWEVDGALFLSNKGEVTARAEAEYDLRITQKLILQPRGEIDFSLQDIPELGVGAGLSEAAVGARLRYQITPLFAPYLGVEYERAFGDTADFRRDEGEDPGGFNLVAGVRVWF